MASSRNDGAGSNRSAPSKSSRKTRSAKKASPAGKPAAAKRSRKGETGLISVKRAGVLPRQAKAPRLPAPEVLAAAGIAVDLAAPISPAETAIETTTMVAELPPAGAAPVEALLDDTTEEIPVANLAAMIAEATPGPAEVTPQEEAAPSLAEVVMPPLDVEPPSVSPPSEPVPSPVAASAGVGWLRSKLRRWTGLRI